MRSILYISRSVFHPSSASLARSCSSTPSTDGPPRLLTIAACGCRRGAPQPACKLQSLSLPKNMRHGLHPATSSRNGAMQPAIRWMSCTGRRTAAAESCWEEPTILYLHLARLMILAPFAHFQTLAQYPSLRFHSRAPGKTPTWKDMNTPAARSFSGRFEISSRPGCQSSTPGLYYGMFVASVPTTS